MQYHLSYHSLPLALGQSSYRANFLSWLWFYKKAIKLEDKEESVVYKKHVWFTTEIDTVLRIEMIAYQFDHGVWTPSSAWTEVMIIDDETYNWWRAKEVEWHALQKDLT